MKKEESFSSGTPNPGQGDHDRFMAMSITELEAELEMNPKTTCPKDLDRGLLLIGILLLKNAEKANVIYADAEQAP